MAGQRKDLSNRTGRSDVQAFLERVAATQVVRPAERRGRLLFGMDATASREPTWDTACQIQGDMFAETASLGGLDVQLAFYRGFREFRATPWVSSSAELIPYMTRVHCLGGRTQLERLLRYAAAESRRKRINAVVFVGDCLEEAVDDVCTAAGELALLGVPCFMFHEGADARAAHGFRQVARLTRGAFCRFDVSSGRQLKELLSAVAVFAAGGRKALADYGERKGGEVRRLMHQLPG
ncbi:MAG TPA: VWA domain-containing protein [Alphaproteobacteria bacterium]|nr:VWA domain-containing protein [Alphaproteobacteria bacterium]